VLPSFHLQSEYGRELPLYEVEAIEVEPIFQRLYSFIFDMESGGYSATEMDRPVPAAIFVLNFDKVSIVKCRYLTILMYFIHFFHPCC
jgi:hypothetical protein